MFFEIEDETDANNSFQKPKPFLDQPKTTLPPVSRTNNSKIEAQKKPQNSFNYDDDFDQKGDDFEDLEDLEDFAPAPVAKKPVLAPPKQQPDSDIEIE